MTDTHRTPFLNCHIDNVNFTEAVDVIRDHVREHVPGFMVSLNTDIAIRLEDDTAFRMAYDAADLALMDSEPLMRLAMHNGIEVKEKLSGSDLMPRICEVAATEGWRCYFLGGREGVPQQAAANLKQSFPGLVIVGTFSPPFGFEKSAEGIADVAARVRASCPDILFICLGTPKSEKILHPHLSDFDVPFTLSVGAAIDFASGTVARAPVWMQKAGLEWLFRFSQEPRRLFKRYFIDSWKFLGIYRRYRRGLQDANCS